MPVATEKGPMNQTLFRNLVRQADSPDGDGVVAVRKAIKQCAQCHPPKLFYEAVIEAFGSGIPKSDDKYDERAVRAEKEVAELKKIRANIETRLDQQERIAESLREANLQLSNQRDEALKEASGPTWKWPDWELLEPDFLTGMVCHAVVLEWAAGAWLGPSSQVDTARRILHEWSIGFFALWLLAAYNVKPLSKLLLRLGLWALGWACVVGLLFWRHDGYAKYGDLLDYLMLPTNWWSAYLIVPTWGDFWIVFAALWVIWESNNKWEVTAAIISRIRNIVD